LGYFPFSITDNYRNSLIVIVTFHCNYRGNKHSEPKHTEKTNILIIYITGVPRGPSQIVLGIICRYSKRQFIPQRVCKLVRWKIYKVIKRSCARWVCSTWQKKNRWKD